MSQSPVTLSPLWDPYFNPQSDRYGFSHHEASSVMRGGVYQLLGEPVIIVWNNLWHTRVYPKFLDWIVNEIYSYNNKHSLRCNTKGYGSKTR
jgi:hypothetical protein